MIDGPSMCDASARLGIYRFGMCSKHRLCLHMGRLPNLDVLQPAAMQPLNVFAT